MNDEYFMRIAIEESKKGDWPYGAILVENGTILVKAFNTVNRDQDTTAHAEVNVIRKALKKIPGISLKGYTLYSSSESCPMCCSAEIWSGISRVVYGASIQQLIDIGQPQINISSATVIGSGFIDIELQGGILAKEALNAIKNHCPNGSPF